MRSGVYRYAGYDAFTARRDHVYTNGSPVNTGFTENADLFGGLVLVVRWAYRRQSGSWGLSPRGLVHAASHASGALHLRAGGNEAATRLSGINVNKIKIISILFVVCWHRWPGSLKWRVSLRTTHGGDWL